jgi:hypothetical protein
MLTVNGAYTMVKRQRRCLVASALLRAAKTKEQRDPRDKETPPYASEERTLAKKYIGRFALR